MQKVSIVMASYNGSLFIEQQVKSIVCQMQPKDELIISDDGSTDGTINIIKSFSDDRIKLLNGPQKGVIKNFEFAIQHASGEIIVLSDQDDIWIKNRLQHIRNYFSIAENMAVYHSRFTNIDARGNVTSLLSTTLNTGIAKNVIKNQYIGAMMAFSAPLKEYILPFPENIAMHDQWIGLVNEVLQGGIKVSEEPEVLYRRHSQNLTGKNKRISIRKKFSNRLFMIYYLLKKFIYIKRKNL